MRTTSALPAQLKHCHNVSENKGCPFQPPPLLQGIFRYFTPFYIVFYFKVEIVRGLLLSTNMELQGVSPLLDQRGEAAFLWAFP